MARFIREKTETDTQCIVISLKEEFYGHADAVVGVTTDVRFFFFYTFSLILFSIFFFLTSLGIARLVMFF